MYKKKPSSLMFKQSTFKLLLTSWTTVCDMWSSWMLQHFRPSHFPSWGGRYSCSWCGKVGSTYDFLWEFQLGNQFCGMCKWMGMSQKLIHNKYSSLIDSPANVETSLYSRVIEGYVPSTNKVVHNCCCWRQIAINWTFYVFCHSYMRNCVCPVSVVVKL